MGSVHWPVRSIPVLSFHWYHFCPSHECSVLRAMDTLELPGSFGMTELVSGA